MPLSRIDIEIKKFNQSWIENHKEEMVAWSIKEQIRAARKKQRKNKKGSRANRRPTLLKKADKMSTSKKIEFFKELASRGFVYNKNYQRLRAKKNNLTSNICYICGGKAYCMHHIIPLSSNGKNRARNLIPVCLDCHKKIHPFMK